MINQENKMEIDELNQICMGMMKNNQTSKKLSDGTVIVVNQVDSRRIYSVGMGEWG